MLDYIYITNHVIALYNVSEVKHWLSGCRHIVVGKCLFSLEMLVSLFMYLLLPTVYFDSQFSHVAFY